MAWYSRLYEGSPWAETAVFSTFETLFMAKGGPPEMLLIEQEHAAMVSTIWMRLPNDGMLSAFPGFEEASADDLPTRAILLIGHNAEFEKLFKYGTDRE